MQAAKSQLSHRALIEAGGVLIDVRGPDEFAQGHLDGALNVPVQQLSAGLEELKLDPKVPVVLYCRSGRRSAMAAVYMRNVGFEHVVDIGTMANF